MKMANIQIILKDGVANLVTLLISIGSDLTSELREISKRPHAWGRIYGLHLRLLWLHTLNHQFVLKFIRVLTGQRLLKISPLKKNESNLERLNVRNCSDYSIKGELPTVRQRLLDRSWSKQ